MTNASVVASRLQLDYFKTGRVGQSAKNPISWKSDRVGIFCHKLSWVIIFVTYQTHFGARNLYFLDFELRVNPQHQREVGIWGLK